VALLPSEVFGGNVRRPALRVLANGVQVPGVASARVTSNNHYAADAFLVGVALQGVRDAAWLRADALELEVEFSLGGGFVPAVLGAVDQLLVDPVRGFAWLSGRDFTARLIEARTQESFSNRTAGEIARILAGRHGLEADVQDTSTPVGRYWQLQRDRVTLDHFARAMSEWDLLAMLAAFEGFDLWVRGRTLHFRAPDAAPPPGFVLRAGDVAALRLERALTLARDLEVTVKSWNARQQRVFQRTARRSGGTARDTQRHVFVVPNLTPDEALKLAQRKLEELTRNERVLFAEMPGELVLAPRMALLLEGAPGDAVQLGGFARMYLVDEVARELSVARGFRQWVRARTPAVS
jgi:hypothetical protein